MIRRSDSHLIHTMHMSPPTTLLFFFFFFFPFFSFSISFSDQASVTHYSTPYLTVCQQDPILKKAQPLVAPRLGARPETISGEVIRSRRNSRPSYFFCIFQRRPASFLGSGTRFEMYSQRFTKVYPSCLLTRPH